jgi:hypothetical protein
MNIDKLSAICQDKDILNKFKDQHAGSKIDVYIPKTESRVEKQRTREKIIEASKKGLTVKQLHLAFNLSIDTIRRYLGKKK